VPIESHKTRPCRRCAGTAFYVRANKRRQCVVCYGSRSRADRRDRTLKAYGITAADYDRLHESQKGLCAVCRQKETHKIRGVIRPLCIDHDHFTGRVRGLLCNRCNTALGLLGDDQATIEALASYHALHEGRHVVD
jgi:hypothetical protein